MKNCKILSLEAKDRNKIQIHSVENNEINVLKKREAVNPGTNKIKISVGSGSYVDAVRKANALCSNT